MKGNASKYKIELVLATLSIARAVGYFSIQYAIYNSIIFFVSTKELDCIL